MPELSRRQILASAAATAAVAAMPAVAIAATAPFDVDRFVDICVAETERLHPGVITPGSLLDTLADELKQGRTRLFWSDNWQVHLERHVDIEGEPYVRAITMFDHRTGIGIEHYGFTAHDIAAKAGLRITQVGSLVLIKYADGKSGWHRHSTTRGPDGRFVSSGSAFLPHGIPLATIRSA